LVEQPVTVITSSGRPLEVSWEVEDGRVTNVWLGGEARVVATGHLCPEGWQE
jgi:hypothetical protein